MVALVRNPSKWLHAMSFKLIVKLPKTLPFHPKSPKTRPPSPTRHTPAVPAPPSEQTVQDNSEKYMEVFRRFDSDGDGKISSEELGAYFSSMGDPMSSEQARRAIGEFDADGDDSLEFQEFVRLMERSGSDDEAEGDIKRAFEMYEVEPGSGMITPEGVRRMLGRLGDWKSYEECAEMIRAFDLDGNGVLDFHEFQLMMS